MNETNIIQTCNSLKYWVELLMVNYMYRFAQAPATLPEMMEQITMFYERLKEGVDEEVESYEKRYKDQREQRK